MKTHGFTLIELSIVLVIIGLLAGGVLLGRDLIRAAEIRGTISQMEKFNTAANTFKLKYGTLPGDMQPSLAGAFGFTQLTPAALDPNRFGNGLIDTSWDGTNTIEEEFIFWTHLSEAKLIEGTYGKDPVNPIELTTGNTTEYFNDNQRLPGWQKLFMPAAKVNNIYFWAQEGDRYSTVDGSIGDFKPWTDYSFSSDPDYIIPPAIAYAIDSKIDDGKPYTGNAVDVSGATGYNIDPADGFCRFGGGGIEYSADTQYNVNPSTGGNTQACNFRVKASF